jgi:uncharacterized lipoprotein YajG
VSNLEDSTNKNNSSGSLASIESNGSIVTLAVRRQHQAIFLLTEALDSEYGVFEMTQKKILDVVKDTLPEKIQVVNITEEQKVSLLFTQYFNKT